MPIIVIFGQYKFILVSSFSNKLKSDFMGFLSHLRYLTDEITGLRMVEYRAGIAGWRWAWGRLWWSSVGPLRSGVYLPSLYSLISHHSSVTTLIRPNKTQNFVTRPVKGKGYSVRNVILSASLLFIEWELQNLQSNPSIKKKFYILSFAPKYCNVLWKLGKYKCCNIGVIILG